jgi:hypothetical protein
MTVTIDESYTCSGISVNIVVKLGDHVAYYSIHDVAVAVSFMEIGK